MAVQWGLLDPDMAAKVGGSFQQGQRNALAMQGAQQEQQVNALKMQQAQREIESQNALSRAFQESGGDIGKAKAALMTAGQYEPALKIGKMETEQRTADLAAKKAELDDHVTKIGLVAQLMSSSHDQASHDANLQEAEAIAGPEFIKNIPKVYNPTELQFAIKKGLSVKDQAYNASKEIDQQLRRKEIAAMGGYRQAQLAQGEERLAQGARQIGMQEQAAQAKAMEEKPLPAAQQSQLIGASNTMDAIKEYRTTLDKFKPSDLLSPDAISEINNKYENMLMQAKEVYKLGALTGPDEKILKSIITNPVSFKGGLTSKKALDKQAEDLARLMSKAGRTATLGKEQLLQKLEESTAPESADDAELRQKYEQYLRSQE